MNPYTGNFAPQQTAQPMQEPLMAPQKLNYQQQMAAALNNQPQAQQGGGGMDLGSIMNLMKQFQGMSTSQQQAPIVDHSSY